MNSKKQIYLVANYSAKPKNPKMTHVKGYMKDPANVAWDESVIVVRGLKPRDQMNSRVILNNSTQSVEKNSFNTSKTFFELFEYFYKASPTQIGQALQKLGVNIGEGKPEEVLNT